MIPYRTSITWRRLPWLTILIMGACLAVFLIQESLPPRAQWHFVGNFALIPRRYTDPGWALAQGLDPRNELPFLSSIFLHGGWIHLIANMWSLWLFGGVLEERMGALRFTLFYALCGIGASLAQFFANPASPVPTIGASGAIAGVMGAFITLWPRARVHLVLPIIVIPFFFTLPAWIYLGGWLVLQLFLGTAALVDPSAGGVAWWAHIGGFAAGWLLCGVLTPPKPAGPWGPR